MIVRTDDPIADATRYNNEQERKLAELPECERCGHPIQQDKAVYYEDQWICEDCEWEFWQDIREDFLEKVKED